MTQSVRRRRWRTWFAIVFYHLLGRAIGSVHVTATIDGIVYESGIHGFRLVRAEHYPPHADTEVTVTLPWAAVEWAEWASLRFTGVRAVLDTLRLPGSSGVQSCVTETARLLGVQRRCRRPDDILLALKDEDYGHGITVQDAEGRGARAAGPEHREG